MDVRRVAEKSVVIFKDAERKFGYTRREHAALMGFFEGVAKGEITVGQSWMVKLLLLERASGDAQSLAANNLNEKEFAILREIFASGMCCEGQQFTSRNNSVTPHRT